MMPESRRNVFLDLFDVIEAAIRVGGPTTSNPLQLDMPLAFGSIGVALGPLANVALSAAGMASMPDPRVKSILIDELFSEGSIQRAILSEAAFGVFVEIDEDYLRESGFFQNMKDVVLSLTPVVKKLAPHLVGVLLEPALRISIETLQKKDVASTYPGEANFQTAKWHIPKVLPDDSVRRFGNDSGVERFIQALLQASLHPQYPYREFPNRTESSEVGEFITAGLRQSRPLLRNTAQSLERLEMAIHEVATTAHEYSASLISSFSGVFQRAVAGEAALQAMMKLPWADLEEQREMPDGSTQSWYEAMNKITQELTPQIMVTAPSVIKAAKAVVETLLKASDISPPRRSPPRPYTPQPVSSSLRSTPTSHVCSPSRPTIRKKKSIRSISSGGIVPLDGEPAPPLPTYGLVNRL